MTFPPDCGSIAIRNVAHSPSVTIASCLWYYEQFPDVNAAIAREKQLKGWRRAKKIALIEKDNPRWEDLSADW